MLSEWLQYQGKAGFLNEFLKWYFLKYWQVWPRWVFAQIVTYINYNTGICVCLSGKALLPVL